MVDSSEFSGQSPRFLIRKVEELMAYKCRMAQRQRLAQLHCRADQHRRADANLVAVITCPGLLVQGALAQKTLNKS